MRSRYSAYVLQNGPYLLASWHPSTRPAELNLESDQIEWLGLRVIETRGGGESELEGEVTFSASFKDQGRPDEIVERSRFVCEVGQWFYLDGEHPPFDMGDKAGKREKVGRNAPCPCGSGKKYKRCCGA